MWLKVSLCLLFSLEKLFCGAFCAYTWTLTFIKIHFMTIFGWSFWEMRFCFEIVNTQRTFDKLFDARRLHLKIFLFTALLVKNVYHIWYDAYDKRVKLLHRFTSTWPLSSVRQFLQIKQMCVLVLNTLASVGPSCLDPGVKVKGGSPNRCSGTIFLSASSSRRLSVFFQNRKPKDKQILGAENKRAVNKSAHSST